MHHVGIILFSVLQTFMLVMQQLLEIYCLHQTHLNGVMLHSFCLMCVSLVQTVVLSLLLFFQETLYQTRSRGDVSNRSRNTWEGNNVRQGIIMHPWTLMNAQVPLWKPLQRLLSKVIDLNGRMWNGMKDLATRCSF